jgi:hypothetical protein
MSQHKTQTEANRGLRGGRAAAITRQSASTVSSSPASMRLPSAAEVTRTSPSNTSSIARRTGLPVARTSSVPAALPPRPSSLPVRARADRVAPVAARSCRVRIAIAARG